MVPRAAQRAARGVAPLLLIAAAIPAGASAQATRTWVSGVGDDANPCSRTAPCKTFAGAISKTANGGEIDALDDGGFGAVTITKSITIDGGRHLAGILASGSNGIQIAGSSSNIRVTLRGLSLNGVGSGLSGIRILGNTAVVRIEDTDITGFTVAGIDSVQTDGTSRKVQIRRTDVHGNSGIGVRVRPNNAGITGKVVISDSSIDDNGIGLAADASIGRAKVTVRNTTIDDNGAVSGTGQGVQATGANATVRLSNSSVTGNLIGLEALTGGQILSFGNNIITANELNNGVPTGPIAFS